MADNQVGDLRRSAVLMTYAPGSVVDMRADKAPVSGVMAGLEEWDRGAPLAGNLRHQKIIERRLCQKLGKKFFRLPPVVDDNAKLANGQPDPAALVARRFPEWLQCPSCEFLRPAGKWAHDPGSAARYCAPCTSDQVGGKKVFAVPVRFVAACEKGHLDEFPWKWWVRHKEGCRNADRFKLTSVAPGLAGLVVACLECGSRRSLDGVFSKSALAGLECKGRRPWLQTNDQSCDCTGDGGSFRVLQRGASNLFYPVIESALDIPPWTRQLEAAIGDYWDDLLDAATTQDRIRLIESTPGLKRVLEREKIDARELASRFESMSSNIAHADLSNLRIDEYRIFAAAAGEASDDFETVSEKVPDIAEPYLESVLRVARLREVRVAIGFTRINPPFDTDAGEIAAISMGPLDWLPAIDVRGEGIFLRLNADKLAIWRRDANVRARTGALQENWTADWTSRHADKERPFDITPRLLLVHTLAHALIRSLTLECGYSSAALRERLYVSEHEDMAGLLIYTATPDAEGTLGGLQRRARSDLLAVTLQHAIQSMQWCSSDPLCMAGEMASADSFSRAACHSCALLPETSCEMHNKFLDRAMLVGTEDHPEIGFFSEMLKVSA